MDRERSRRLRRARHRAGHRSQAHGRVAAGLLVVLVVLGACGGGGGGGPAANDQNVDEQLGLDQAGLLRRQTTVEALVRDCMKVLGFEYVPVDPAARQAALVGSAGLTEEEFEKQYGYGITTLYERRRLQASGGPNQTIREGLSEPERVAYDRALVGENLDATFSDAVDSGDFNRLGGCTRKASEEAFGGAEVLSTVQSKLDDLDARILADPRMVVAIAAWSDCMRTSGFELPTPDQVDVVLKQKLAAIVGPTAVTAGNASGTSATGATYDEAALAALGREEVAMVGADIACEERHIVDVEESVQAEYERAFREQNTGLLSKVPPP